MDFIIIVLKFFVMVIYTNHVKSVPHVGKSDLKLGTFLKKYIEIHKINEKPDKLGVNLKNGLPPIAHGHIIPLIALTKKNLRENYNITKKEIKKREHYEKIRQITKFLKTHVLSTNYFYDEMQRIIRDRQVKDEVREMVSYLDSNAAAKSAVLKYFHYNKISFQPTTIMWDHKPNDLVINVLKDPYNDGVIS